MRAPSVSSSASEAAFGQGGEEVLLLVLHVVGDELAQHREGLDQRRALLGLQVVDLLLDRAVGGQRPVEHVAAAQQVEREGVERAVLGVVVAR